jgi:hypothetical protein
MLREIIYVLTILFLPSEKQLRLISRTTHSLERYMPYPDVHIRKKGLLI